MTRERDRYGRASWGEQLREGFASFWRNRPARIVAAVFLAGFVVLRLLTPDVVPLASLAAGDCLYFRPPGPSDVTAVPTVPGRPQELDRFDLAERASCDLSHSHEVSDVFAVGGAGDPYPGLNVLADAGQPCCEAAFEPFVGRPRAGSRYTTAMWPPNEDSWLAGARTAACLVFDADRTLLDHRARGSGE